MNYYEILQVSENASEEVIRMAYKALAKKYHPDVFDGDPKIAEHKMKELNEAYEVLSNQPKRMEYDAFINKTTYDNLFHDEEKSPLTTVMPKKRPRILVRRLDLEQVY